MSHPGYETPALLAAAITQGDLQAEAVLFERYYRPLLYVVQRKCVDPEQAQEICQEAFCIMLERLRSHGLEEPDKLAAFLHNVASNLHIAEVRKSGRRKTQTNQDLIDRLGDARLNPYRELLRDRKNEAVRMLLGTLDNPRDRKLLHGFYIDEREKADLCTELNLSLRHFDKVLFRAKQRFRQLVLEDTQDE